MFGKGTTKRERNLICVNFEEGNFETEEKLWNS